MIPNLEFVKATFLRYNTEIFNSELPEPRFNMTRARSFRGKLCYRIKKTFLKTVNHDFEMRISISFDIPQLEWEDVVIHEMIHLYIASKGIKDQSSHGPEFRKVMHFINKKHGRNIRVSAKSTAEQASRNNADKRVKAHYICLAKFSDGRLGVAPVAKTRIFRLWNDFNNFAGVESLKWIGTTDPWFNSFPHVRSPKLYLVSEEDLRSHLKGAVLLNKEGNVIKIINRRCCPDELLP